MNRYHTLKDPGATPLLINLHKAAEKNSFFRQALWTGTHLQLTVMCLSVGEEIGEEMHECLDQMLRVEEGVALVKIGSIEGRLRDERRVGEGCAILIPAGTYHNIVNVGKMPLRLSSVYGPPAHPLGTQHKTKEDAEH